MTVLKWNTQSKWNAYSTFHNMNTTDRPGYLRKLYMSDFFTEGTLCPDRWAIVHNSGVTYTLNDGLYVTGTGTPSIHMYEVENIPSVFNIDFKLSDRATGTIIELSLISNSGTANITISDSGSFYYIDSLLIGSSSINSDCILSISRFGSKIGVSISSNNTTEILGLETPEFWVCYLDLVISGASGNLCTIDYIKVDGYDGGESYIIYDPSSGDYIADAFDDSSIDYKWTQSTPAGTSIEETESGITLTADDTSNTCSIIHTFDQNDVYQSYYNIYAFVNIDMTDMPEGDAANGHFVFRMRNRQTTSPYTWNGFIFEFWRNSDILYSKLIYQSSTGPTETAYTVSYSGITVWSGQLYIQPFLNAVDPLVIFIEDDTNIEHAVATFVMSSATSNYTPYDVGFSYIGMSGVTSSVTISNFVPFPNIQIRNRQSFDIDFSSATVIDDRFYLRLRSYGTELDDKSGLPSIANGALSFRTYDTSSNVSTIIGVTTIGYSSYAMSGKDTGATTASISTRLSVPGTYYTSLSIIDATHRVYLGFVGSSSNGHALVEMRRQSSSVVRFRLFLYDGASYYTSGVHYATLTNSSIFNITLSGIVNGGATDLTIATDLLSTLGVPITLTHSGIVTGTPLRIERVEYTVYSASSTKYSGMTIYSIDSTTNPILKDLPTFSGDSITITPPTEGPHLPGLAIYPFRAQMTPKSFTIDVNEDPQELVRVLFTNDNGTTWYGPHGAYNGTDDNFYTQSGLITNLPKSTDTNYAYMVEIIPQGIAAQVSGLKYSRYLKLGLALRTSLGYGKFVASQALQNTNIGFGEYARVATPLDAWLKYSQYAQNNENIRLTHVDTMKVFHNITLEDDDMTIYTIPTVGMDGIAIYGEYTGTLYAEVGGTTYLISPNSFILLDIGTVEYVKITAVGKSVIDTLGVFGVWL